MRIPPSVIVMSVVTAVPFGLGVRDTLKHKAVSAEEFGEFDLGSRERARDRAYEEYEAERRREEIEREAKNAERITQLDQLIGEKPGQMGSLFEGIELGSGAGSFQPEHVRKRIENATRDGFIAVQFDADAKSLNGVDVVVGGEYDETNACDKLDEKLEDKWGSPTNHTWLDTATHQRASFKSDSGGCHLRFERYVDAADWVAALPVNAVGMASDKFAATLAGGYDDEVDHLVWHGPGTGYGNGPTTYDAFVVNGKIRFVTVTTEADFDSTLKTRDALSAKLKAQPKLGGDDDTYQVYTWKKRVPVELETTDRNRFTVSIGNAWD